jgi:hypothetical protein
LPSGGRDTDLPPTVRSGGLAIFAESSASTGMYKDVDECMEAHGTVMDASGSCA